MVETIGAFQCVNNLLFLSDNTERKVNHWSIWYGIYIVCELKKYWICVIVFDFEKEKKIILYLRNVFNALKGQVRCFRVSSGERVAWIGWNFERNVVVLVLLPDNPSRRRIDKRPPGRVIILYSNRHDDDVVLFVLYSCRYKKGRLGADHRRVSRSFFPQYPRVFLRSGP